MASDPIKKLAEQLNKVIIERRKTKTEPLKWAFAEDCFKIGKFWKYRLLNAVCLPNILIFICRKNFFIKYN